MLDWLVVWGVGQATLFVFRPILEDLAKDVAKDASKSYVGRCFKNVFSGFHREALTKVTGLALKNLLELIETELIRAGLEDEDLREWTDDVRRFIDQDNVRDTIASLFLRPDYSLDPKTFAAAWQRLENVHTLPDGFSWQFVAKRFAAKVAETRQSSSELRETFTSLAKAQDSTALQELAGLPPGFDLDTYREALVERYGSLDFAKLDTTGAYYSDVRLWSVFVPQSVRECHEYDPQLLEVPKEHLERLVARGELNAELLADSEKLYEERRRAYVNQPRRPLLAITDDQTIQRFVILGDPGSGKSSLLRFLALRWAQIEDANLRYTQPLQLLIELREYNRWECSSSKDFPKYLHEASTWHRLNQQTLDHLLKQPDRVVLLLDGLDEVFDPVERERVINDIHRFSNAYKHVRIIVTSRVAGYQPHRLRNADFRHFMLQDLDESQIGAFLNKWHHVTFDKPQEAQAKRQRLAHAIEHSKSIAQLAGNPLLLTMMVILNRNQKLPDDRVDLYQQCSRLLLHQWDVERTLDKFPGLSDEIGLREKTDILRCVAYAMQTRSSDKSRANYIDGTSLTKLVEGYLHTELRFDQARAVARALVEQLRTRNFILCYLGADSYAFVHRTFLEYFCAADIVHQFNVAKTLSEQDLISIFDNHCRDDDWREVLRLICGQIDEQFVGRIVEHLAKRVDLQKWDGVTSLAELPLAIGCLSEVRNPSRLERSGDALLKQVVAYIVKFPNFAVSQDLRELTSATRDMGTRWPGQAWLKTQTCTVPTMIQGLGVTVWPKFVAYVLSDRAIIQEYTSPNSMFTWRDKHIRASAIDVLAEKWPDEATRQLLTQRAVADNDHGPRRVALQTLAEKWPDDTTRQLLTQRAVEDQEGEVRGAVLHSLAEKWPDDATRQLLTQRAVEDQGDEVRDAALQSLAEKWPDETTRQLFTRLAVEDQDGEFRSDALWYLAEKWPDETTRKLLTQRAVADNDHGPRKVALQTLAEKWPDDTTRQLLMQQAVEDNDHGPRRMALQTLAENWPDQTTRQLLTQRAVADPDGGARGEALAALARKWPDETTRQLLTERVLVDQDGGARSEALRSLGQMWPDETTRQLLTQLVEHQDGEVRSAALGSLAVTWQEEAIRLILTQRAIEHQDGGVRRAALRSLAEKWPDETTRQLLTQRAVEDPSIDVRGLSLFILSESHSEVGRILPTRNLDGHGPYLDPLEPIPREHIDQAAAQAGLPPEEIDATVRSLSKYLGWDITRGAKTSLDK